MNVRNLFDIPEHVIKTVGIVAGGNSHLRSSESSEVLKYLVIPHSFQLPVSHVRQNSLDQEFQ